MTGTKEIRTASIVMLQKFNEQIESLSFRLDNPNPSTDKWITESWAMEKEFLTQNKDSLEKQIIENEFNF